MSLNSENIMLGSGHLYFSEYDETTGIPADSVIETEANRVGHIKDGASLSYTPTYYQAKDDLGLVSKTILSEEAASFKTGVITWNFDTLAALIQTGKHNTSNDGTEEFLGGGVANYEAKKYVLRFVHVSKKFRITMVVTPQATLELALKKDTETSVNCEFTCEAMDAAGHLFKMTDTTNTVAPSPEPEPEPEP